jgi:hypothetical protein
MQATASVNSRDGQPPHGLRPLRRWAGVALALLGIATLLFVVLPYWSAAGLLKAAADDDVGNAASFIQERQVEQTIGEQTSEAVQTQAVKAVDKGWPGAAAALESDKSAPLAAELSNIGAVTSLIRTHLPANGSRLAAAWDLASSDSSAWVSANAFQAHAPGDYVFSWKRRGLGWQLVDVQIPQHVIEAAAITGEQPVIEPQVEVFKHP